MARNSDRQKEFIRAGTHRVILEMGIIRRSCQCNKIQITIQRLIFGLAGQVLDN
jgi:hypothetical protein